MSNIFQKHKCLSRGETRKYLDGSLSAQKQHRVENHLLDCPLCRDAVSGLRAAGSVPRADFGSFLARQETKAESRDSNPLRVASVRRPGRMLVALAACVVLLAGIGLFVLSQQTRADADRLAINTELSAEYYSDYQATNGSREARNEMARLERELPAELLPQLDAYNQGADAETLRIITNYLAEQPATDAVTYFAGLTAFELHELDRAESFFATATKEESPYYEPAAWFLALTQLKNGKPEDAKQVLTQLSIRRPESEYTERAVNLLDRME